MLSLRKKPYLTFIAPGFIIYTLFMIIPLFVAVYYSFFKWSGIGPKTFIGLENYHSLFADKRLSGIFWNALGDNFKFVLAVLFVIMPIQLFIAYWLDIKIIGYRFHRTIIFLPYIISSTIIGFLTMLVFNPNIGIINTFLKKAGFESHVSAWFGDPKKAFGLLIIVIAWQGIAGGMFIFLANLKGISKSLIEAAFIDGATRYQRFRYIILPCLEPALINNIILGTIWALTQFDIPFVVGGSQGGINNSIDFVNLLFYRFTFGGSYYGETSMGFGAAISIALFIIILCITIIQLCFLNRKFSYNGKRGDE